MAYRWESVTAERTVISYLTDIAKYRTLENPGYVIQNWMRNRNTVRFLGLWEHFHNPEFNYIEFEAIERDAELIKLGLSRADRAVRLNIMAIEQLRVLNESDERKLLK